MPEINCTVIGLISRKSDEKRARRSFNKSPLKCMYLIFCCKDSYWSVDRVPFFPTDSYVEGEYSSGKVEAPSYLQSNPAEIRRGRKFEDANLDEGPWEGNVQSRHASLLSQCHHVNQPDEYVSFFLSHFCLSFFTGNHTIFSFQILFSTAVYGLID